MNKKIMLGMLVLALAFGMMVASCGGDDDSTFSFNPINPSTLPSFDGDFVTDEDEARDIDDGAYYAVAVILAEVLDLDLLYGGNIPSLSSTFSDSSRFFDPVEENININHKGLTGHARISVSYTETGNTYNLRGNYDILIRVSGTYTDNYSGISYKVEGIAYEARANYSGSGNMVTGSMNMTGYVSLRSGYTITRLSDKVGMKLTSTLNMSMNINNQSGSVTGNASVKIFDNNNVEKYSWSEAF